MLSAERACPDREAVQLTAAAITASLIATRLRSGPSASIDAPKSFGSWLTSP
jgi:hypothetical protein